MIGDSFRCHEYFVVSMSVVASKVCFTFVVSWMLCIMRHQQCLLIYTNVRIARSSALKKHQEVRPPNLGMAPPAKLGVAPPPRLRVAPPPRIESRRQPGTGRG